jgi:hypothetical protein
MLGSRARDGMGERPGLPDPKTAGGGLSAAGEGVFDLREAGRGYNPLDELAASGAISNPADRASFLGSLRGMAAGARTAYSDYVLWLVRRSMPHDPLAESTRRLGAGDGRAAVPDFATAADNVSRLAGLTPEGQRDGFLLDGFRRLFRGGAVSSEREWQPFLAAYESVGAGRRVSFASEALVGLRAGSFKEPADYAGIAEAFLLADARLPAGSDGIGPVLGALAKKHIFTRVGDLRSWAASLEHVREGSDIPAFCAVVAAVKARWPEDLASSGGWDAQARGFQASLDLMAPVDHRPEALLRLAEAGGLSSGRGWGELKETLELLPPDKRTADFVGWDLPQMLARLGTWGDVKSAITGGPAEPSVQEGDGPAKGARGGRLFALIGRLFGG